MDRRQLQRLKRQLGFANPQLDVFRVEIGWLRARRLFRPT
jgi:hypothetical protein